MQRAVLFARISIQSILPSDTLGIGSRRTAKCRGKARPALSAGSAPGFKVRKHQRRLSWNACGQAPAGSRIVGQCLPLQGREDARLCQRGFADTGVAEQDRQAGPCVAESGADPRWSRAGGRKRNRCPPRSSRRGPDTARCSATTRRGRVPPPAPASNRAVPPSGPDPGSGGHDPVQADAGMPDPAQAGLRAEPARLGSQCDFTRRSSAS